MAFNPNEHMMNLKGKDYLQVMWRLVWFREEHPDWCIDASILEMDADHAVFKAVIADENGAQKCSGHGSESKRDFGDFIEKAETKAIGRALAMLGYGTQFTAQELDEGERIVDSPVKRGSQEAAQKAGDAKLEEIKAKMKDSDIQAVTGPATDAQKAYIHDYADDEMYVKCMDLYGPQLEKLSAKVAERIIQKIRENRE